MAELLKLASQCGMSPQQAKAATSGLLNVLQSKMDPGKFDEQVRSNVPGADEVMNNEPTQGSPSTTPAAAATGPGGLLGGALMSALGSHDKPQDGSNSNGPTSIATLLASLMGQGVDPKMVQKFLPVAAAYIQKECKGLDAGKLLGLVSGAGGVTASSSSPSPAGNTGGGGNTAGLPGNLGDLAASFGIGKK